MKKENIVYNPMTSERSIKENPKNWSILACAILSRYRQDLEAGFLTKEDKVDPVPKGWIDSLSELSERFHTFVKVKESDNDDDFISKLKKYYLTHTCEQTSCEFGLTQHALKSILKKYNISKPSNWRKLSQEAQ